MASRSEKMYSKSPKIEKDADGKAKVTKGGEAEGGKEAAEVNSGTQNVQALDLHQKHAEARMDMHHKHEKEYLDMYNAQNKEIAGSPSDSSGKSQISKTEQDKGEK